MTKQPIYNQSGLPANIVKVHPILPNFDDGAFNKCTNFTRPTSLPTVYSLDHHASAPALRSFARRCGISTCVKTAKSGGYCISHGGGKRCSFEQCTTSVVSRGYCVAHGGGKRCQFPACTKSAQSGGYCWIHGGGKKCGVEGCAKRAQSGGACISHGGGKRCRIEGCHKVVQFDGLCVGHGGYRKCSHKDCTLKAIGNGFCLNHGGIQVCIVCQCKRRAMRDGLCGYHRRRSVDITRMQDFDFKHQTECSKRIIRGNFQIAHQVHNYQSEFNDRSHLEQSIQFNNLQHKVVPLQLCNKQERSLVMPNVRGTNGMRKDFNPCYNNYKNHMYSRVQQNPHQITVKTVNGRQNTYKCNSQDAPRRKLLPSLAEIQSHRKFWNFWKLKYMEPDVEAQQGVSSASVRMRHAHMLIQQQNTEHQNLQCVVPLLSHSAAIKKEISKSLSAKEISIRSPIEVIPKYTALSGTSKDAI